MLAETGRRVTLLGCSLSNGLIVQMIANRVALLLNDFDRWLVHRSTILGPVLGLAIYLGDYMEIWRCQPSPHLQEIWRYLPSPYLLPDWLACGVSRTCGSLVTPAYPLVPFLSRWVAAGHDLGRVVTIPLVKRKHLQFKKIYTLNLKYR